MRSARGPAARAESPTSPISLFEWLTGFGPPSVSSSSFPGAQFDCRELERRLFGSAPDADRATASLLALATFARRRRDQRVLLPTRLHMFFRGLPGLFACINPECDQARDNNGSITGRLFTQLHDRCGCGGRVYEFLTHRECGTAFLRGYMLGHRGDFLWHVPSGPLREGHQTPLTPVEILIDGEPHPEADDCVEAWHDVQSGRIVYDEPTPLQGFRKVYLPTPPAAWQPGGLRFRTCPVCTSDAIRGDRSTIMDHSTKGEAPFANLVKTQLDAQPAVKEETRTFPNGGRKVLLFSDGRQKAARLARDIPREVEQDIFARSSRSPPTGLNP